MRKLVCSALGRIEWEEYAVPNPGPGEVRIRSLFGAEKHGTMQAFVKGYANERGSWDRDLMLFRPGGVQWSYPIPLGNIIVGEIEAAGPGVSSPAPGDRVACFSGFRPYFNLNAAACFQLPETTPWQSATCLDPAMFALGALRDGQVRLGDRIAVFGLGAIGLMTVRLARIAGCAEVIGLDPIEARRTVAGQLGATVLIDPTTTDAGLRLKELTANLGVDVAVDFSGSGPALQSALRGVAFGGNVVAGAFPPPYRAGLDFGSEAHHNRPNLIFSRACSDPNRDHPRWNEKRLEANVWSLITRGEIDGRSIVNPVVDFDDLLDAYPKIAQSPETTLKLGVRFP